MSMTLETIRAAHARIAPYIVRTPLLCEPSSAIGMGAALCGRLAVREGDKACFVVSGGSVALEQLHQLEDVRL